MEEPSIEYDQGFIDGTKEGKRQLQERIKELEAALYNIAYKMAGSSKSKQMAKQALKGGK